MSDSIVKQIAGLHRLTGPQLKDRWRELYGTEPPGYNRTFLIKRLAYWLQALTYGGLPRAAPAKMNEALTEAGSDELGAEQAMGKPWSPPHSSPVASRAQPEGSAPGPWK